MLCVVAVVVPVIARVRILVRHRVLAVLIRPEVVSERRLAPDVDLMMRMRRRVDRRTNSVVGRRAETLRELMH